MVEEEKHANALCDAFPCKKKLDGNIYKLVIYIYNEISNKNSEVKIKEDFNRFLPPIQLHEKTC
jgi:hypothetical protein